MTSKRIAANLQARLVDQVAGLNDSLTHHHTVNLSGQQLLDGVNATSVPLNGPDPDRLYERTAAWLRSDGWRVVRHTFGPDDTTRGETRPDLRRVRIEKHLDPASAAAVLLHEAAHITLGHGDSPIWKVMFEAVAEVEAESTAYLVAGLHGLDTSQLSVGYISGWAEGDPDHVRMTAKRVIAAAQHISDAIDDVTL